MPIEYRVNAPLTTEQFLEVLIASGLSERRPVEDRNCLDGMLLHSNLMVSAWCDDRLIGVARSVTDLNYACYLSDLAVAADFQGSGVGKQLLRVTQAQLGPRCKLILIAAPAANAYYERIGFSHNSRCWLLERDAEIEA